MQLYILLPQSEQCLGDHTYILLLERKAEVVRSLGKACGKGNAALAQVSNQRERQRETVRMGSSPWPLTLSKQETGSAVKGKLLHDTVPLKPASGRKKKFYSWMSSFPTKHSLK